MAREGMFPLPSALDRMAGLFLSRRLGTAVPREMDGLYAQLVAPSVNFVWAQLLTEGEVPIEGLQFVAWVRMAPSPHTLAHARLHCAYRSQPCKGLEDHMGRYCPVVLAAALTGFKSICTLLRPEVMPYGAIPWGPQSTTRRAAPRIGG